MTVTSAQKADNENDLNDEYATPYLFKQSSSHQNLASSYQKTADFNTSDYVRINETQQANPIMPFGVTNNNDQVMDKQGFITFMNNFYR